MRHICAPMRTCTHKGAWLRRGAAPDQQPASCSSNILVHSHRHQPAPPQRRSTRLHAKKQKKGGQKKGPSKLSRPSEQPQEQQASSQAPWETADTIMLNMLMVENYRRKTGRVMLEDGDMMTIARDLFYAPFALLYHNNFEAPEQPLYQYANQAALDLYEATWEELIGQPSSSSASQAEQDGRTSLMHQVADKGIVEGCSGARLTRKGRPVELLDLVAFNVEGADGERMGQGTVVTHWVYEDGTHGGPDAPAVAVTQQQVDEAQLQVQQQANAVRSLKDGGKGNSDPEVQAAVEELLKRKSAVEQMQAALDAGRSGSEQPQEVSATPD